MSEHGFTIYYIAGIYAGGRVIKVKERNLQPLYVDILDLITRKAEHFFAASPKAFPYHIIRGDSRTTDFFKLGRTFSRVITSPPYYGMRTYVPDQWLRYWFLGGPATVEYHLSKVYRKLGIRSRTQLATVLLRSGSADRLQTVGMR